MNINHVSFFSIILVWKILHAHIYTYMVKLGYNDLSLCDTSSIALYVQ